MEKENCVICGKETTVDRNTHVDFRINYIDGVGQLCKSCFNNSESRDMLIIPKDFIFQYPNNYELGEKVREFYNLKYNK
jgi:hypothetical protein